MANEFRHRPVLLRESVEQLHLQPGATVVDGTLGGGGHAAAILAATAPDGVLIGFDLDPAAHEASAALLAPYGDRVRPVHASFRRLADVLEGMGIARVDGVLLDLGVSSPQLDVPERGFSFADREQPLDMRMDPSGGASARDLLRDSDEEQLARWFREYGELPGSHRLARSIVERRDVVALETTGDLLDLIGETGIGRGRKHNPATLVFQALRIAVNDELGALEEGLEAAIDRLRPGGRVVVIAYHSLEDRIVKHRLRAAAKGCTCPPRFPVCVCGGKIRLQLITRRPVRPTESEIAENPRARSARLRAAERVEEAA